MPTEIVVEIEPQNPPINVVVEQTITEIDVESDFIGLKGDKGDKGDQGDQGLPGEEGDLPVDLTILFENVLA